MIRKGGDLLCICSAAPELGLELNYSKGEGVHDLSYWHGRIGEELMPFFYKRGERGSPHEEMLWTYI